MQILYIKYILLRQANLLDQSTVLPVQVGYPTKTVRLLCPGQVLSALYIVHVRPQPIPLAQAILARQYEIAKCFY